MDEDLDRDAAARDDADVLGDADMRDADTRDASDDDRDAAFAALVLDGGLDDFCATTVACCTGDLSVRKLSRTLESSPVLFALTNACTTLLDDGRDAAADASSGSAGDDDDDDNAIIFGGMNDDRDDPDDACGAAAAAAAATGCFANLFQSVVATAFGVGFLSENNPNRFENLLVDLLGGD